MAPVRAAAAARGRGRVPARAREEARARSGRDAGGKGGKSNNQMVELRNDMSKAQAQMEMQSGAGEEIAGSGAEG